MNTAQPAGHSVRRVSQRFFAEALLRVGAVVVFGAVGLILIDLDMREEGSLFVVAAIVLAWGARSRARLGAQFKVGAIAEERVGSRLWKLEELGWLVEHDVQKRGGGNIDHVVQSPAVTFVIETKAGGCRPRDLAQVRRHAQWAAQRYGGRRVIIPVLCQQRSNRGGELVEGVYRVGADRLVALMLDRG